MTKLSGLWTIIYIYRLIYSWCWLSNIRKWEWRLLIESVPLCYFCLSAVQKEITKNRADCAQTGRMPHELFGDGTYLLPNAVLSVSSYVSCHFHDKMRTQACRVIKYSHGKLPCWTGQSFANGQVFMALLNSRQRIDISHSFPVYIYIFLGSIPLNHPKI